MRHPVHLLLLLFAVSGSVAWQTSQEPERASVALLEEIQELLHAKTRGVMAKFQQEYSFMDAIEGTAKGRMLQILDDQPDDSSFDQLLRELAYRGMVERGLADS